jgi:uncharacterized membrane protein YbhN (UPF0104 family)
MNARLKEGSLTALRFGLSAVLLAVAFLMIDFSDRTLIHLASGEQIEAVSAHRTGAEVHAVLHNRTIRVVRGDEVKSLEERPGIFAVVKRARLWPAVLVIPLIVLIYSLQALRWRLLLTANGFRVPVSRVLRITWAGAFFNQVLPGSVGGDVAKALIVAQGEERKAGAFGTVILDRIVGLATILIIAAIAILPVIDRKELRPVVWLIVALLGGGALGAALYFSPLVRNWAPARRLKDRLPFRRAVEEVDDVLKTMHHAPRTILQAVGLSAAGQAATILAIYALAVSLGADIPLGYFFLIEPIIFLVTAVPLSVGGWGVEQVAYAQLFGMVGMAANTAVALSVLYKLCVLALALPGGVLFATGATRRATPSVAPPREAVTRDS